jgi:hypothetical protein
LAPIFHKTERREVKWRVHAGGANRSMSTIKLVIHTWTIRATLKDAEAIMKMPQLKRRPKPIFILSLMCVSRSIGIGIDMR